MYLFKDGAYLVCNSVVYTKYSCAVLKRQTGRRSRKKFETARREFWDGRNRSRRGNGKYCAERQGEDCLEGMYRDGEEERMVD